MKHIKFIKVKLIFTMLVLFIMSVSAQEKLNKVSQSVNVDKDVTIHLNTSYTNIEIETWNKNIVEVEAFMESEILSKGELQKVLDAWDVDVDGSGDDIRISSNSPGGSWDMGLTLFDAGSMDALKTLELELANIPEMPIIEGLVESLNFADMPKLPGLPDLPKGMNNFNFDYDKYKKDGQSYLDDWSDEYEVKYGKEYSEKMEAWAKNFDEDEWKDYEKKMETWGEKFGEEFGEKFGKDFEVKMEAWGEKFGEEFEKSMEAWGEKFGAQMEEQAKLLEQRLEDNEGLFEDNEEAHRNLFESYNNIGNQKVKRTLKIKMPKKAKLKINVRHGELKMASVIHNLKADVSHSALVLNSIDGGETSINASFSSVLVDYWNAGELKLNYVEDAELKYVNELSLNSNSSNININNLIGNAIIDGSFGDLKIKNIEASFNNLNIILENSDAILKLPKSKDYNLFFKGNRSKFNHESTSNKTIKSDVNTNKTIVINAKFSNVIAK